MKKPSRAKTTSDKVTVHYLASTHWDREWHTTFQDFRFRLVSVLDGLIELMERDPEYKFFQIDGQTIALEDYLEIRPERRERLQALFDAGRVTAGPWYAMPDEFIVCGESLVRNLHRGHLVAEQFGPTMKSGYVCDIFGHNSQFPQILHGFGIDTALVWRGTSLPDNNTLFRWQASDGSEVLAYNGHYGLAFDVRYKALRPDGTVDQTKSLKILQNLINDEKAHTPGKVLLLCDGNDHQPAEPAISAVLAKARKAGIDIIHSTLPDFFAAVRRQKLDLLIRRGELRYTGAMNSSLIPGVLSSRMYLKQANARCENRLLQWAEPFSALAEQLGDDPYAGFLNRAWKSLLANHPHDSICGCSIDRVHQDMVYRFNQCQDIADHTTLQSLRAIADRTTLPKIEGDEDIIVSVFNPTSDPIDGVVDLPLYFRRETQYRWFAFEPIIGFRMYDPEGGEVAYQRLDVDKTPPAFWWDRPNGFSAISREQVRIATKLKIPAHGWTTLVCKPTKDATRSAGTQVVDDHTMENKFLRVQINSNGSIDLTDRKANRTYHNQLTFEDRADIGDGWYHGTAVNDEIFTSCMSAADIALIHDGFALTMFRVRVVMNVPERFLIDDEIMRRSDKLVPLQITSWLTLRAGSPYLEVRTEVNNVVCDHRLRALFPTDLAAKTYFADSPYDVVERPIALRPDSHLLGEPETEAKPQYSFTAVNDGKHGLAVISTGQPESAVRDIPSHPIALTLFRGFPHTVECDENEMGGQMLGRTQHLYWIYPHTGALPAVDLLRMGQRLAAGVECIQTEQWRQKRIRCKPMLPVTGSWLRFGSGPLVLTACKQAEDGGAVIIRTFNPTDETVQQKIGSLFEIESAGYADMLEQPTEKIPVRGKKITITAGPRKIITIRLELGALTG